MVMICFKGAKANQYPRAIMLNIFHFWYWKQIGHPCADIVSNDPINFVEEDGEVSLGLLAHTCSQHKIRFDHKALSELYQLIGLYRETLLDTQQDLGLKFHKQNHVKVRRSDDGVKKTVAHFKQVIKHLKQCVWEHYPKFPKSYFFPKLTEIGCFTNTSQSRFRPASFSTEVRTVCLDLHRLLLDENGDAGIDGFPQDSLSWSSDGDLNLNQAVAKPGAQQTAPRSRISSKKRTFNRIYTNKQNSSEMQSEVSSSESSEVLLTKTGCTDEEQVKKKHKKRRKPKKKKTTSKSKFPKSSSNSLFEGESHVYSEHEYVIGYIHCMQNTTRGPEYLVHWKYFPDCSNDTWQSKRTLEEDCPEVLKKFLAAS